MPVIVGSVFGAVGGSGIMIVVVIVVVFKKKKKTDGNLIEMSLNPHDHPDSQQAMEKMMEKRWKIEYQEIQIGNQIGQGTS